MKFIFAHCQIWDDADCKLGSDWYRFDPVIGSKFPGSKGFTIAFYLIWWYTSITWVKDHKAYRARLDYRHSDRFRDKK